MHAVRRAVLLACALSVLGAARAASPADEPKIEVHSLTFKGVRQVNAGQLRAALATRTSSRLPWGKSALFDRAKFEADLQRIHAFYADRGFPDARVTSFDVKLNKQNTSVDLTITVVEGEPIKVASIEFVDLGEIPARRVQELRRGAPLKVGQPLDRPALAATREMVLNLLRDSGYPFARVAAEPARGADPRTVTVQFRAEPGVKSFFGPTSVSGNLEVSEGLIRRELLYHEGDLYRRSVVQESQRKLYDLELFQFVSLRPNRGERSSPPQLPAVGELPVPASPTDSLPRLDPVASDPSRVPMNVTVTESKHRRVNFSAGYGSDDKLRVQGQYRQLNFLGGARTATLRAKWSSLDRGVRVEFNNPYFFAPRWSLQLNGERWYDNEPAFTSVASGAHAVFSYKPGTKNVFAITVTDEYQSSEISNAALSDLKVRSDLIALGLDPTTGSQRGTINALEFDARRTTAPNPLNPTRGYLVSMHLERAGRWVGGTYAYSNVSGEARYYIPLGSNLVIAARTQVGSLRPSGNVVSDIPFARRYFLGGASSLRGWGRYELSPLSGSGLPIGGFSMAVGSLEARMSITESLGAVAFLDFGNVWLDPWHLHFNDLRYDVGPGLRYATPIGPLRVDLGWQINPVPGLLIDGKPQTRRWRVHFSIGQAF